jgi:NAD(P)-dependent dehydrogenase (short-subunit alcohol dehydrogenase family)
MESDLCRFKIRVNTICPGIFPSEMTGAKQSYEQTGMDPGAQKGALRSPLGELARF